MTIKKGWARAILAHKVSFMCFENKSSMSSQAKRFIEENIELIEIGDHDRLIRKAIVDLSSKHFDEVKGILGCKNIDCGFLDSIQRFYTSNRIKKIKCYNVGFGDCFLCKGENENGTKMNKAKKLGVPIIEIDEWIQKLKNLPSNPEDDEDDGQLSLF